MEVLMLIALMLGQPQLEYWYVAEIQNEAGVVQLVSAQIDPTPNQRVEEGDTRTDPKVVRGLEQSFRFLVADEMPSDERYNAVGFAVMLPSLGVWQVRVAARAAREGGGFYEGQWSDWSRPIDVRAPLGVPGEPVHFYGQAVRIQIVDSPDVSIQIGGEGNERTD